MKTKKQFILDTLLPYKEDQSTCAFAFGRCSYLTHDGRKCAVGKHMKEGKWRNSGASFLGLLTKYSIEDFLTEEAISQKLPLSAWTQIQEYHDNLAREASTYFINDIVESLEEITGESLLELKL